MTKQIKQYLTHILLFLATLVTTVYAGMWWVASKPGPWQLEEFSVALPYAFSILFILTCHEFGHYFAARFHKVNSTLPYYIPFPPLPGFINFGTVGAVIKTKSRINSNKAMFDIGIAGPIAGFVATLLVLGYGFSHLPGPEYILKIHPDYFISTGHSEGELLMTFGKPVLYSFFQSLFTSSGQFVPPMTEMYHYPYLLAGWFGLFVTALNMIPVGQLDGGHIFYAMFGEKKHSTLAHIIVIMMGISGMLGLLEIFLPINFYVGWVGWLFWCVLLIFIIKIKHPPAYTFETLGSGRMILGYISFVILVLSFSVVPISASIL